MIIAHIWVCGLCVDFLPTLSPIIIFVFLLLLNSTHVLAFLASICTCPLTDLQVSVTTHSSSSSVSLSFPFTLTVSSSQPLLPLIKHFPFLLLLSLALFNSCSQMSFFQRWFSEDSISAHFGI